MSAITRTARSATKRTERLQDVRIDERGVITTLQPQFGGKELLLRPREIGVELRYSFQ